ncbi:MAG: hypothetical protein WCP28_09870 [Actinomycetes bacterium]
MAARLSPVGDSEPTETASQLSWESAVPAWLQGLPLPQRLAVEKAVESEGGIVSRDAVLSMLGQGPRRQLRGFTRPYERVARELKATGILGDDEPTDMVWAVYSNGPRATGFAVDETIVAPIRSYLESKRANGE